MYLKMDAIASKTMKVMKKCQFLIGNVSRDKVDGLNYNVAVCQFLIGNVSRSNY